MRGCCLHGVFCIGKSMDNMCKEECGESKSSREIEGHCVSPLSVQVQVRDSDCRSDWVVEPDEIEKNHGWFHVQHMKAEASSNEVSHGSMKARRQSCSQGPCLLPSRCSCGSLAGAASCLAAYLGYLRVSLGEGDSLSGGLLGLAASSSHAQHT